MNYKKNILILFSGSAIAQIITIAISPLLTRLYTPGDFGLLALYLSLCSILSVFASGRYDISLIEPADESKARGLMFASIRLTIFFCLLIALALFVFKSQLSKLLGNQEIESWLIYIPITVFTMSCYSIFTYWLNRVKNFKAMNSSKIIYSVGVAGFSLGLAFTPLGPTGLIIGTIVGQMLSVSFQWHMYIRNERGLRRAEALKVMKEFVRYPKFLIPSTLAGTVALESPIILFTRFFEPLVSGLFSFANRVTVTPMSFIGNSIGEVYRVRAAEHYQQHGECRRIFLSHVLFLVISGIIPWAILYFGGPKLFVFLFGAQWEVAGQLASILSFAVWFQLVSTPLSYTITLNHSQHLDLFLQLFRLLGTVGAILIGSLRGDYILAVKLYTVIFCSYYFGHSLLQYRAAKGIG